MEHPKNTSNSTPPAGSRVTNQRISPRQQQVIHELRERIVSGGLKPGSILPQRTELAARFGVSGFVIQRALDQLVDEGHVNAIPGKGTFVTLYPPHTHHYGIVLSMERLPAEWRRRAGWSNFWTAIEHAAETLPQTDPVRISIYYGISGHIDDRDDQRLRADIASCRLAGLFLLNFRHNMHRFDIPLIRPPVISLVGEETSVVPDMVSFFAGALDELRRRGRKRIAVLVPHKFQMRGTSLEQVFAQAGFELPPWRKLYLWAWGEMENISNTVQLLLRGPADERPDGLIIADDHLVTYASVGIMGSGLTVPQDLDVVAFANFPLPTLSHVPALRRGFDARTVLNAAVQMATRMRAGLAEPCEVLVPAVNESEIRPLLESEGRALGMQRLQPF